MICPQKGKRGKMKRGEGEVCWLFESPRNDSSQRGWADHNGGGGTAVAAASPSTQSTGPQGCWAASLMPTLAFVSCVQAALGRFAQLCAVELRAGG